jgi:hypothetical protein
MKRIFIVGAALFALAGCSSGQVKLGVDVAPLKVASSDLDPTDFPTTNRDLEVTRVRLLVAHAKIGYAGRGCMSDETDIGPNVVDLTADEIANGAHREFDLGELPSGTYGGAEIEIMPIDQGQDASGDEFADFRSSGASLLVDGLFKGKEFTFAGHWLAEQGTDGEVEVDASKPLSIAMTVDTSSWFKDASDVVLDPTDVTQHDALSLAICKTLDTQEAIEARPPPPGGRKGPGPGPGGGGEVHCVEGVP